MGVLEAVQNGQGKGFELVWQGPNCDARRWGQSFMSAVSVSIKFGRGSNSGKAGTSSFGKRLNDACGERVLTRVVRSNRRTTVTQIAKELMLIQIESCQNTLCVAACCVCGCIAADKSGFPCWLLSATKGTNNGYMSIRNGPQSNRRRWPGLMNPIHLHHVDGCVHLCCKASPRRQCDIFGQCSAGKPWVLPSM